MNPIRVLLVEDHETVREGLRLLLDSQSDMEVVAEACRRPRRGGVQRTLPAARRRHGPVDAGHERTAGDTGDQAKSLPETAIVALTRHDDAAFVDELKKAGASAYVLKQSPSRELLDAVRTAAVGGTYLDAQLRARDARTADRGHPRPGRTVCQRPRKAGPAHDGRRSQQQGDRRGTRASAIKTVEVHKANAMRKLRLRGRIDVVRFAILHGWLQEP